MRETISIHIGQAGSQIGDTCWDLFCLEHGIDSTTGDKPHDFGDNGFFSEGMNGNMKARALFVDLDPEIIDNIRTKNSIYDCESLISGNESAVNNFAKGRDGSRLVLENCLERIEKMVGECHSFQGFMITSSLNGGCGTGFRDLLMERLSSEYEKKFKLSIDIIDNSNSSSCLDPYNVLFGMNTVRKYSDISIIMENEALIEICRNNLKLEQK